MNRRQLFLSTAKAALASALGSAWLTGKARAQTTGAAPSTASTAVVHGTPGSPDATVSIDGRVLPPPSPPFGGVINETAQNSTPWWPPRVVPPQGAPNVLLIMTDDQGYGVSGTFGGVIPTPALDRVANAGLRYTQFHSTALCSPTRAALITGRNHHEVGFGVIAELSTGYPRLRFVYRSGERDGRPHPARAWLRHVVVRQEPQHAGLPIRRSLRSMAVGNGLRLFLRVSWAARPTSGRPICSAITPRFSPWIGKPGYNLTTDLADEAMQHMRELNATAPDQPFFVYYVPGGSHSPHQPTQEWIDKFKGKFDMGWNAMRDEIFANQKRLGVIPPDAELTPWPDNLPKWEIAIGRRKEAVCPASRGVRSLHGLYRSRNRPRHPGGRGYGQARQHADHLHLRRQRHEPGRHAARHAQSVHVL